MHIYIVEGPGRTTACGRACRDPSSGGGRTPRCWSRWLTATDNNHTKDQYIDR